MKAFRVNMKADYSAVRQGWRGGLNPIQRRKGAHSKGIGLGWQPEILHRVGNAAHCCQPLAMIGSYNGRTPPHILHALAFVRI